MKPLRPSRRINARVASLASVFLLLSVLLAASTGCMARPHRPVIEEGSTRQAEAYLESMLSYVMKKHRIPGVAVVVVHDGRVASRIVSGESLAGGRQPLDEGSRFMAGSLTKVFTALAVMRLVDEGAIDLEADIRDYLPGFSILHDSGASPRITVRQLLTHTSGLMIDHYQRLMGGKVLGDRELLELLGDEVLCFDPGSAVKYSNVGYTLLGMIVERAAGESFEAYMRREVLEPIGMVRSTFELPADARMVAGHDGDRRNKVLPILDTGDSAASGMVTTIGDLAAFLRFLSSGRRIDSGLDPARVIQTIERIADRGVDTFYDSRNLYSAGWSLDRFRFPGVGSVLSSSGNVNGFSSEIVYVPERRIGMAILSNSSHGWKADLEIVARGLGAYLEATGGAAPRPRGPAMDPVHENEPDKPAAGLYAGFGVSAEVFHRRGKPYMRFRGPAARLRSLDRGLYFAAVSLLVTEIDVSRFTEYDTVRFRFYRNAEGSRFLAMEASYEDSVFSIPLQFAETAPVPDAFLRRIGSWELDEEDGYPGVLDLYLPSKRLNLLKRDGRVMLETVTWMGTGYLVLEPLSDDLARIIGSGEVIRFTDDELRFIGLRFKRTAPLQPLPG